MYIVTCYEGVMSIGMVMITEEAMRGEGGGAMGLGAGMRGQ